MKMTLFSSARIQALQWLTYRFFDRIGLIGKLALIAILLAAGFFLLQWLPVRQQLSERNAEVENQKISQAMLGQRLDPQAALEAYIAQFPPRAQKNSALDQWMQIAAQHDLQPDSVTYKTVMQTEKASPLQATLVDFSVNAPYADIQHFLNQVLMQLPFVAIEQLSLTKEEAEEEAILAHIQLKFYFATPLFADERRP